MSEWPHGWTRARGGADDPTPRGEEPTRLLRPEEAAPRRAGEARRELPPELSPRRGAPTRPTSGSTEAPLTRSAAPFPPPGRRRRTWLRALVALLVLVVGFYLALAAWAMSRLTRVDALGDYTGRPADVPGRTYLLVGSDSRGGLSPAERRRLRTGSTGGERADTIMLLHEPAGGRPTLVSLPRDSYVPIPGHGRGKLNAAFAAGGPALLVRTVEQVTGLRVDDYLEVGFAGVVGVTDAVGGVRQCIPRAIRDTRSGLDVRPGCQQLDGRTALGYVRARYFDPRGDLGRVERQQQYLAALVDRVASPATLLNPVRMVNLARAGTGALTVDERTGVLDLLRLTRAMARVSGGGGTTTTVPVADPDYRRNGESYVRWDQDRARALFASLRAGRAPS